MKIKNLLLTAILTATIALPAAAQSDNNTPEAQATASTETGYINMDFDGMMFQLPAGIKVERGSKLTAIYPDGTFGLTMETVNHPSTKKIAFELCERLADSLGMPRGLVKKINFGNAKGAKAQGLIDGLQVTCLVLAYGEHQLLVTVMADPKRGDWASHFMETLRR